MGKANMENVWVMRCILKNMELILGLTVNFDKCGLLGVNVNARKLEEMLEILRCKIGNLHFSYLGISVGTHYKRASEWNGVVKKIKRRSNGEWSYGELMRVLGSGQDIQFWEEEWVGEELLKSMIPRFFNLNTDKEGNVGYMGL
ncbi:hypothetical protein ACS0TY_023763 [Phlomoides rotata]